jgi:Mg-chelatase subunit ChlD
MGSGEGQCSSKVDALLLVDASGSVNDKRWGAMSHALDTVSKAFANGEEDGARLGVILFGQRAKTLVDLATSGDAKLPAAPPDSELGSTTNFAAALIAAEQMLLNQGRPSALTKIVILTDGRSPFREKAAVKKARHMRESGVVINGVVLNGYTSKLDALEQIVSIPVESNLVDFPIGQQGIAEQDKIPLVTQVLTRLCPLVHVQTPDVQTPFT